MKLTSPTAAPAALLLAAALLPASCSATHTAPFQQAPGASPPATPEEELAEFTVTVQADWGWQASGIAVKPGDLVEVSYVMGKWNGDGGANPAHGPDGPTVQAVPAHANYPLPGEMEDSLIGRVGEDTFFVGSHCARRVESEGEIDFTINDTGHSDNSGEIQVLVRVFVQAPPR